MEIGDKPHVVRIPGPVPSHIKAMLKLAKLVNHKGCHITFVNTEFNHSRFLKSRGPNSLDGLPDFVFRTIPDGLPPSEAEAEATQDIPTLAQSIRINCLAPFLDLVTKLNSTSNAPPVTSILSDGFMSIIALDAAQIFEIPVLQFWTISAGSFMGFYQFHNLRQKGFTPLKDESYLTDGYLDTLIDWIPGMKDIRLRDLPSFMRTTNPNDIMLNFCIDNTQKSHEASGIILHTFDALESDLINALSSMFPSVYTIGPQQLLLDQILKGDNLESIGYNLWKEEPECLQWLDTKEPNSVVYVNFGSITVMGPQQLLEFAMGLANSNHYYLWIIRPDLVVGETAMLPPEFETITKERGFIAGWCPQEEVLNHPSVGGFLTHGGWNSILESITSGVPMICWPFFADQPTNCRYICTEWEIAVEIDQNVQRDNIERLVKELMGGDKGKEMKRKVLEWKKLAEEATSGGGSSYLNLDKLVKKLTAI